MLPIAFLNTPIHQSELRLGPVLTCSCCAQLMKSSQTTARAASSGLSAKNRSTASTRSAIEPDQTWLTNQLARFTLPALDARVRSSSQTLPRVRAVSGRISICTACSVVSRRNCALQCVRSSCSSISSRPCLHVTCAVTALINTNSTQIACRHARLKGNHRHRFLRTP